MMRWGLAGGRRKGEATRRALLASGARVFGKVGYVNAEVAMIIADAGRGRGTFYIYFDDKADLLRALVSDYQEEVSAHGMLPTQPFEGTAAAWLTLHWSRFKTHVDTFQALAEAASVNVAFADLYDEVRGYVRRDFIALIEARSPARPRPDVELVAAALETMVVNCFHEWLATRSRNALHTADQERAFAIMVELVCGIIERT